MVIDPHSDCPFKLNIIDSKSNFPNYQRVQPHMVKSSELPLHISQHITFYFKRHKYSFHEETLKQMGMLNSYAYSETWTGASAKCQSSGDYLMEISDAGEFNHLQYISAYGKSDGSINHDQSFPTFGLLIASVVLLGFRYIQVCNIMKGWIV